MAFTTASGYGNLPSGNFAPEIFSQKVLKFFRRASVVTAASPSVTFSHPCVWASTRPQIRLFFPHICFRMSLVCSLPTSVQSASRGAPPAFGYARLEPSRLPRPS